MENGVQSAVQLNPLRKCVHQSKQEEVYIAAQQIAVYAGATSQGCIVALIFLFQCPSKWVALCDEFKVNKLIVLLLLFECYEPLV